jgi:hypothetical protein
MVPRRYSVVVPSGGALQPVVVAYAPAPGPAGVLQPASRASPMLNRAARFTAPA